MRVRLDFSESNPLKGGNLEFIEATSVEFAECRSRVTGPDDMRPVAIQGRTASGANVSVFLSQDEIEAIQRHMRTPSGFVA